MMPATLETFLQDARYALRTLARAPGFTVAALATIALGIGANTAIFSVVHAVLLRPLPYPEPDRIVELVRRHEGYQGVGQTGRRYLFFREHADVQSIAAWRGPTGVNLAAGDAAEFVDALHVSKEYFETFAVRPALGTSFSVEHDLAGGPDAVVLGHGLWQRVFGGNPAVLGSSVLLGERPHVVIGVMPQSFVSVPPADLYTPLRPSTSGPGGGFNYRVAARLRPGTPLEQLNAQAAGVWQGMKDTFPKTILRNELPSTFEPLQTSLTSDVRSGLLTILGAVGLLLLIACANTANLLLARASGRGREIAVRSALGAARSRVVRQLLTESVLLSIAGACLGVALAYWALPVLLAVTPSWLVVYQDVRIDATVLLIALSAAVITGVLFGLAPALGLSRTDLIEAFKDDGTRSVGAARSAWLRGTLVVAEVALCMVLLVSAGLLIQTFVKMRGVDPGFDPRGVVTARMSLLGDRYASREVYTRLFEEGIERLRRIPGVREAAVVNSVPIATGLNLNADILDVLDSDGNMRFQNVLTDWRYASTEYFTAMGIPIVAGRGFEPGDRAGAPPVAVVNESFARRYFKGTHTLGQRIRVFDSDGAITIVGVAKDVREQGLVRQIPSLMYVPVWQANPQGVRTAHLYFQMNWVVRADMAGASLEREMREVLRSLDPNQPVSSFQTMEDIKSEAAATERFHMTLVAVFAGIGLLLATAGVYGVVSYSVAQRTREFGIRLALGATHGKILGSVLRSGVLLAAIGVVVGLAGSVASSRILARFVWGVSPLDPVTLGGVGAILVIVATLASLMPALRAMRLNAVSALRE
jgi:putative ABC transport system permease protein